MQTGWRLWVIGLAILGCAAVAESQRAREEG